MFLRRNVVCGILFAFCNNGALSVVEFYMPVFFQIVMGFSASKSGVMVLPTGAGLIMSVPLAGVLTSLFGYYNPFMILNGLITTPATTLITMLKADTKIWMLILYQFFLGFGTGIGFQGPQVAVQATLPDSDSQVGIAIIQLAQALGPAISLAAAQTIFSSRLVSYLKVLAPKLDPATLSDQGFMLPGSNGDNEKGISYSYNKAFSDTFYLALSLACVTLLVALGMGWQSVKSVKNRRSNYGDISFEVEESISFQPAAGSSAAFYQSR